MAKKKTTKPPVIQDRPIATVEPGAAPAAITPMELMGRAIEKGLDPDQLEKFMDLQERYEDRVSRAMYAAAMSRFQGDCPTIRKTGRAKITTKTGGAYQYTFPKLSKILATIKPHLKKHGLSVSFSDFDVQDAQLNLACIIRHETGYSESFPFAVPVDPSLTVNDMQKIGISNSYCRRYALCNALNLVGADDDSDGHPDTEFITREQAKQINADLDAVEADKKAFCEYLGVDSIPAIPASKFKLARQAITRKIDRLASAKVAQESANQEIVK
jgi:hypothetical protein